jgi:hypothetical protein
LFLPVLPRLHDCKPKTGSFTSALKLTAINHIPHTTEEITQ